jgi:glycosyltransferase involved in cell wall biosynthesis
VVADPAYLGSALKQSVATALSVLLVEPDLTDNGALRVSLDRAARWVQSGALVTLLVVDSNSEGRPVKVPPGVRMVYANPRQERARRYLPAAMRRGLGLARNADVVVAGREIQMGLLVAAAISVLARRPLAVTVQSRVDLALDEYVAPGLRGVSRAALRSCELAVCVSAGLIPILVEMGIPAARAHTVENGLNVLRLREAAKRELAVALPPGPLVVACGRLTRQKGFDLLLQASALALARGSRPHNVLILGEGPERPRLERLISDLAIGESTRIQGFVENPYAYLAQAELFVLPSRWEGYPLVLAEALTLGVPVVAADCIAGPSDVVQGGRFGRLVPPDDVDALALAIEDHLQDPRELRVRAADGAQVALGRFDPERAAASHLALLSSLARRER